MAEKKPYTVMLSVALYVEAGDEIEAIQEALTRSVSEGHRQNVQVVPGTQTFGSH